MFHKQPKSLLRRVLKGFSASNYCIALRLWQPDFCWDHTGVPLAFSMTLTTYAVLVPIGSSGELRGRPGRRFSAGAVLVFGCFAIYVTRD